MKMKSQENIRPQDVVILLKIVALGAQEWFHHTLAQDLGISQSEVSQSLNRSKYAGLIDESRKKVMKMALLELLEHGIRYIFPQRPGALVRGIPTAHSASPLNKVIQSDENYVWPSAKGQIRGQAIMPLYPSVLDAIQKDPQLYELLALVDAIRVGRAREIQLAKKELEKRLC
jgi:DNA-binding transcriptional ArsR family regulator